MTKIIVKPDCGNAPKKELLKQLNIAFAKGNSDFLSEIVSDDIQWDIMGDQKISGKEQFIRKLDTLKSEKVSELILERILTHGKEGAANGIIKMQNGKEYAFSDFYEFTGAKGAKVRSITSYIVRI
ncbi:MAG: nuclear transport factor 2 family protein [Balneola sp.]|nr:nuclear transport factor 2 family protein [Balneola sp.]MBO6651905.1 nuclear transport factor 2 family protein [Balneola sp.]MBO6709983.1 nuclear transport factor 2 family protein [Balneola sp.]MBO6798667.1 nuclear transport factor 2 family protein [Balneola sp.]MBO6871862.1 nuclear transport factor 2 family protein [Balneola sp.]